MMQNDYPLMRPIAVDKLSPAAARLLLALHTLGPGETYDDALERSGITGSLTFLAARKQLVACGFIIQQDGREYITFYKERQEPVTQESASIPYIGMLRTTDAKQ